MSRVLAFAAAVLAFMFVLSFAAHGAPPDFGYVDAGPLERAAMVAPAPTVAPVAVTPAPLPTIPSPPTSDPLGTVALVILALGLATAIVRRAAPAVHFFQTTPGLLALSILSAMITGVSAALTVYGFAWRALVAAAISGATSALCAWNPSAAKKAAAAMLIFFTATLTACPGPTPTGPTTPTSGPTLVQQIEQQASTWATTCAEPALAKLATQILPEVVLDLVSGNWAGLLSQLVATLEQQGVSDGLSAITCAIANLGVNARSGPMGASSSTPILLDHALQWLTVHQPAAAHDGGTR